MLQARKIRFFERSSSKTKKKAVALQKAKLTKKYEYLRKIGKLKDDRRSGGRGRR